MNIYETKQDLKHPPKIGKYQILEELGKGGMGCVYKVFDPEMDRVFALKVLLNSEDQEHIERFIREAKTMAKIDYPNIVKLYVIGQDSNCPFFTMDYIEGVSLRKYLKSAKINVRSFLQMILKIGKTIAYAHKQEIIHRDLKPANIMLDKNNEPYVMDFGLVRLAKSESLTQAGAILGTPQYMSPEQAKGEKVNYLTDVYSLGAILYEMLAKKPLVKEQSVANVLFSVAHEEPVLLRKINNKISKNLEIIIHKAVAKQCEKRYQSVEKFVQDIERFLDGRVIEAKASSIWERFWKKIYKNRLTILSVFLISVGTWIYANKPAPEVYMYLRKAKKWQQKAMQQKNLVKKIEMYMEASSFLEKALEISPDYFDVKEKLIKVQKTVGILVKEKDFLLSFALFKRCKKLGDKEAQRLINKLEKEKQQLQKKHHKFIEQIMYKISQSVPQDALLNRFVFAIVKMKNPHVIRILVPYLKSSSKWQRLLAIKSLGKFGNTYTKFDKKDSVEWLLQSLAMFKDKKTIKSNQEEIEEIIWALGWLKDKRANAPVHNLRWFIGQHSILWEKTKIPYKWIPLDKSSMQNADQFVIRGTMNLEKGDFKKAIADFSKAITLDPKHSLAYNNRGNVYLYMREYVKAITDYSKAITLKPDDSLAYSNRGRVYLYMGQYTKAIADYSKAITLRPKDPRMYSNRGSAYLSSRRYTKAIADFDMAIACDPKSSGAYRNRGDTYRDLREYTKAIADLNKAIALNPKDSEAYNIRGNVYKDLKEYTTAIANYDKAMELNPKNAKAYSNRGHVYVELKEHAKAVSEFSKAVELDSKNPLMYYNRGKAYLHIQKYAKAVMDFSKTIALNPGYSKTYNNRGNAYRNLKKYAKAITDFNKAIALNPKYLLAYYNRGFTYELKKEYFKAIADYSKVIVLNPRFPGAYNKRGDLYRFTKKYKKAIIDYTKVIALVPKFAPAYTNRGGLYLQLKQYKKAYQNFLIFLKVAPNHPSASKIRAVVNHLQRKNLIK